MQVVSKLTYRLEVSARELALIRRALEHFGPPGSQLVRELVERQKQSTEVLRRHFEALVSVETEE